MKEIRIQAKSEAHAKAIMGAFQALGYAWYKGVVRTPEEFLKAYPYREGDFYGVCTMFTSIPHIASWGPYNTGGATHDSIEAAIESLANTKTVKLNDAYTAEVTKDGIKVGCQTFTHEAVEELYKASVEARGGK